MKTLVDYVNVWSGMQFDGTNAAALMKHMGYKPDAKYSVWKRWDGVDDCYMEFGILGKKIFLNEWALFNKSSERVEITRDDTVRKNYREVPGE